MPINFYLTIIDVIDCKVSLAWYIEWYNYQWEHSSLDGSYPAEIYFGKITLRQVA